MKTISILALGMVMGMTLVGCESTQQNLKSWWADTEGVKRTAYIYNQFGQEPLMVIEDDEMRTERNAEHPNSIRIWAGSKNHGTTVHGGVVIIQDR